MKHIEKTSTLLDFKNNLYMIYDKQLTTNLLDILKLISVDYKIPLEELENKYMKKYNTNIIINKKPIEEKKELTKCKAKIHNGNQCSRNCINSLYCKKHIKNRTYGDF